MLSLDVVIKTNALKSMDIILL